MNINNNNPTQANIATLDRKLHIKKKNGAAFLNLFDLKYVINTTIPNKSKGYCFKDNE